MLLIIVQLSIKSEAKKETHNVLKLEKSFQFGRIECYYVQKILVSPLTFVFWKGRRDEILKALKIKK